jgi:hypothetical protein
MENGEQGAFPKRADGAPQTGLTKREYFAGLAMQGMLANLNGAMMKGGTKTLHPDHIAEMSVIHADAVLRELDKPNQQEQ